MSEGSNMFFPQPNSIYMRLGLRPCHSITLICAGVSELTMLYNISLSTLQHEANISCWPIFSWWPQWLNVKCDFSSHVNIKRKMPELYATFLLEIVISNKYYYKHWATNSISEKQYVLQAQHCRATIWLLLVNFLPLFNLTL